MRLVQDTDFSSLVWSNEVLELGEYVNCVFENCDFNEANLSQFEFEDCTFKNCNLSMTRLTATSFRKVTFENCKMMGIPFNTIQHFLCELRFLHSNLNYSIFSELKVKDLFFDSCTLVQADFSLAELRGVVFKDTDLSGAVFQNSNLTMADFRTAIGYQINPEATILNKARFSKDNLEGLVKHLPIQITE